MKIRVPILLLLFTLTMCASGALAQISALAESPGADNPAEKDSRMEKQVTLQVACTKLEDAMRKLTEQTGVVLKAGGSEREWRVRERLVTIQAKDVKLGTLLNQITTLLRYRVSRGKKDGQFTYLIWQDKNSRELEADLLISEKEAGAKRMLQSRQSALALAEAALKMTPEDALKERSKDPWAAYLGSTKAGRGYADILSLISSNYPNARDLMLRGRGATIHLDKVDSPLAKSAQDAISGGILAAAIRKESPDYPSGFTPTKIVIKPMTGTNEGMAGSLGMSGFFWIMGKMAAGDGKPMMKGVESDVPLAFFPLSGKNTAIGRVFGGLLFALDDGLSMEEAQKQIVTDFNNPDVMAEALGRTSPTQENPPTDPFLTREVEIGKLPRMEAASTIDPTHQAEGDAYAELSRAIGMPVLVETFSKTLPVGLFIKPGKQPFYKVLISLEKAGYVWDFGEGMFRIKPEDWATNRSYEVPESRLIFYKELLKKNGFFNLDDLAAIVTEFTDAQIQNRLIAEPEIMYATAATLMNPMGGSSLDMLRLYGSLSTTQKQQARLNVGLPFASMTAAQYDYIGGLIAENLGGLEVLDGSLQLKLLHDDQKENMGGMDVVTFEITAFVAGEEQPRNITEKIMIYGKKQIEMMKSAILKGMKKYGENDGKAKTPDKGRENPATEPSPAP